MPLTLTLELANQLNTFLTGSLSLSAYREAMMRFRLGNFDALAPRDKAFVLEFETRYAQLKANAIDESQFKSLIAYAGADTATAQAGCEMHVQDFCGTHAERVIGSPTATLTGTFAQKDLELTPA